MAARTERRLDARLQRDVAHPVALALSGGGDSMALLSLARGWARSRGRTLTAITVDHGLNPASADWTRTCADAAASLGVGWVGRRWQGAKPASGLTAAARTARHALIAEAAREAGARVVLFAHTADDVDEGDWMRARSVQAGGSTLGRLREWSASPAWPQGRGLMLLRPLLGERREGLRDHLRAEGRTWIEDPGNTDERFGRSRARRALSLLPSGEGLGRGEPDTVVPDPPTRCASGALPLTLGEGFRVMRTLSATQLAAVLVCAGGGDVPPRGGRLAGLVRRLHAGEDFTATLSGARVEAHGEAVVVGREAGELKRRPVADIALTAGQPTVWDGRYEITVGEDGWCVGAAAGRIGALSDADRDILKIVPTWARGGLAVLFREDGSGPILAGRRARVRHLAVRRLALSLGETTREADLFSTIHGETPPTDLFAV